MIFIILLLLVIIILCILWKLRILPRVYFNKNNYSDSLSKNKIEYPLYWINLERSKDRKQFMIDQFNKFDILNHKRINAIDGNLLDNQYSQVLDIYKNVEKYKYLFNKKRKNQIGCLFSHLKAIKTAHDNNLPFVVIMEDDLTLKYMNNWPYNLKQITSLASKYDNDWEIIQLHTNNESIIKKLLNSKQIFVPWNISSWSTGMYIINRKGINKIYNLLISNNLIKNSRDIVADVYLYDECKTLIYTKPLVNQGLNNSIIDQKKNFLSGSFKNVHLLTKNYLDNLK